MITQQEKILTIIIEGNELIADFMNGHFMTLHTSFTDGSGNPLKAWIFLNREEMTYIGWDNPFFPSDKLIYHKSWEWLMPACEKCEKELRKLSDNKLWQGQSERRDCQFIASNIIFAIIHFDKAKAHEQLVKGISYMNKFDVK